MRLGFHYTLIRGFVFLAETLECIILFHFLLLKWGRRWIVLLLNSAVTFLLIDNYFGSVWRHWASAPWCRLYQFSCSPQNWDSLLWAPASVLFDWLWRRFLRTVFLCHHKMVPNKPPTVLLRAFLYQLKNWLRRK